MFPWRIEPVEQGVDLGIDLRKSALLQVLASALQSELQSALLEWLEQIVQGMDFKSLDRMLVIRRDKDDGRKSLGRQRAEHVEPRDQRHLNVEEHKVRAMVLNG